VISLNTRFARDLRLSEEFSSLVEEALLFFIFFGNHRPETAAITTTSENLQARAPTAAMPITTGVTTAAILLALSARGRETKSWGTIGVNITRPPTDYEFLQEFRTSPISLIA
jgi:hypothetical protein